MDDVDHAMAMEARLPAPAPPPAPPPLPPPRNPCERVDRIVRRTRTRAHADTPRGAALDRGLWLSEGVNIDVTDCAPRRFLEAAKNWPTVTHFERDIDPPEVYERELRTRRAGSWGDFVVCGGDRVVFVTDPTSEKWTDRTAWERSILSIPGRTFHPESSPTEGDPASP